ncbi:unnamed protein product [Closterium sp. NIES-54]
MRGDGVLDRRWHPRVHELPAVRPCCDLRSTSKAAEGQDAAEEGQLCRSTVFGPTCDGSDTILRDVWLPRLDLDDWLVFPKMGAYTQAAGSSFNGFVTSDIGIVRIFSSAFPEAGPSLAD